MERFRPGALIGAGNIRAPGAGEGEALQITDVRGELPHGTIYGALQGSASILLTVVNNDALTSADVRDTLYRELEASRTLSHKNLLQLYGWHESDDGLLIARESPGGKSLRHFCQARVATGKGVDLKTAFTLCAHICNGLAAVQRHYVHGCLTQDTVFIGRSGRVLLSATGERAALVGAPDCQSHRDAGLLSTLAPELFEGIDPTHGADVFSVGALLYEMLTERAFLPDAYELDNLAGLPAPVTDCIERATAPSIAARPPDALALKDEMAETFRSVGDQPRVSPHRHATPVGGSPPLVRNRQRLADGTMMGTPAPPNPMAPPADIPDPGPTGTVMAFPSAPAGFPAPPPPTEMLPPPNPPPPAGGGAGSGHAPASGAGAGDFLSLLDTDMTEASLSSVDGEPEAQPAKKKKKKKKKPKGSKSSRKSSGGDPDKEARYLMRIKGVDRGPYTAEYLRKLILAGKIPSTKTVLDRDGVRKMVVDVPGLRDACMQMRALEKQAVQDGVVKEAERKAKWRDPNYRSAVVTAVLVAATLGGFAWAALEMMNP